jgi:hypothetical protein
MKLLTKEIKKSLPKIYSTEDVPLKEKIVICRFFTPDSNWQWFVFEGEEIENGDVKFWGMVHGLEQETGYFLLSELSNARGPWGLPIERDIMVFKKPYKKLIGQHKI